MELSDALSGSGVYTLTLRDAATGRLKSRRRFKNKMCNAGVQVMMAWINLENPTLTPIYGAVGTGSGTPAATDVALFAELQRIQLSYNYRASQTTTFDFFYTTSQANGTLTEAGVFLAASGTAGSGALLSHALITQTKNSSETLTLEVAITLTPA